MPINSERVFHFLDTLLEQRGFPDYPGARNGLQVEGPPSLERVAVAVDASKETIEGAAFQGAGLLIVHHGLFWGGFAPIVGPRYEKLRLLVQHDIAVYASHLPLDGHPTVGNGALLARDLGFDQLVPFGDYEGRTVGWWTPAELDREALRSRLETALAGPVRVVPGGPEEIRRIAVVTGGGASFLAEAAARGVDTLVTGEAPHHAAIEARELGINLLLGGHYATETFGVRALGAAIEAEFGLPWTFLEHPTGF